MRARVLGIFVCLWAVGHAHAQTTAGIATTVVFPVAAQTATFASEMTLFNPGPNLLTASVSFYEANNSGAPGPKVCNDVNVPAGRSVQITLATQCALTGSGGHFGLVVVADKALPQVNAFDGYMRVQNPQGIGFSVEGFPVTDFSNQVGSATGLKRKAAAPTYQTNCFVGSLDQPVSYQLKLFNGTTGVQVGGTLTGSLTAFQQFRYLDVFGSNGVNAPAGDLSNIRAEFTQTSGGSANLIGFCTVQDNTSFGADFRIAKSYGSPSDSFFAQGGNSFGTTAKLGTLDNQPLTVVVNGQPVMRYIPDPFSPSVIGGHPNNSIDPSHAAQTIAGGGAPTATCPDPPNGTTATRTCGNTTGGDYATVGGGVGNAASGTYATVAGGAFNTANGFGPTTGGGYANVAADGATVGGGNNNGAYGVSATIGGGNTNLANFTGATVGGGASNDAEAIYATVGGGSTNLADAQYSTTAGGEANNNLGDHAAIGGGRGNHVIAGFAAVAGGEANLGFGDHSAIGGGSSNQTGGQYSVIAGGDLNLANGDLSTIPGGYANQANGAYSFAAGRGAIAGGDGSFTWADDTGFAFDPSNGTGGWGGNRANTFSVRATGGVWFLTGINASGNPVGGQGVEVLSNNGAWQTYSDRNGKDRITPVDPQAVLQKLLDVPIATWKWKGEDERYRHMGPMAQDFYAAFQLGADDRHIVTVDADGVALAAIQGLHQILQDKDATIEALQREITALKERMASVESMHDEVAQLRATVAALTHGATSLRAALH